MSPILFGVILAATVFVVMTIWPKRQRKPRTNSDPNLTQTPADPDPNEETKT